MLAGKSLKTYPAGSRGWAWARHCSGDHLFPLLLLVGNLRPKVGPAYPRSLWLPAPGWIGQGVTVSPGFPNSPVRQTDRQTWTEMLPVRVMWDSDPAFSSPALDSPAPGPWEGLYPISGTSGSRDPGELPSPFIDSSACYNKKTLATQPEK